MKAEVLKLRAEYNALNDLRDSLLYTDGYERGINNEDYYNQKDAEFESNINALANKLNLTYANVLDSIFCDEVLERLASSLENKKTLNIEKNAVNNWVEKIELKGYLKAFDVNAIFNRINKYYPNIYKIIVSGYGSKTIVKV